MDLRDRIFGADERVSLQRDATLVKLKGEATASLDLAKIHELNCNYVAAEWARSRMDDALDALLRLGVGR